MSSWYLMNVQIKDIQTEKNTIFIADHWIAIDKGTFEDDVTIPATKISDEQTKDYLFKSGLSHKFKDDHIWWSVFSRPLRSRFTRKQRVTTCMTLVMLSLMTCGMYYDGSSGLILDPLTSFGPLGFDARDVSLVKGPVG